MMMEEVPLPQWWPRRWCDDVGSLGDFAYIDRKSDKSLNIYKILIENPKWPNINLVLKL